jgi:diguanylate cyclase (GGDEF)-like protein
VSGPQPRQRPFGIVSSRLLAAPALIILLLAALPWIGERLETGRWPTSPWELTTEVIQSAVTLLLGWWIVSLLRREQKYTLKHLKELEYLTLTDPLTGLGNRRSLERDLPLALNRSDRLEEPLALLYMDIDHFKQLNDRFGHATGDETLRMLGAVLRSCSRLGSDTAYRVGGDEFVMTLVADRAGAEALGERITREFMQRSPRGSRVSLGVVAWDGRATAAELIDRADSRMYQSKLLGSWSRRASGEV